MKPRRNTNARYFGDQFKSILGRAGVSYQELADRLNHNGFLREDGRLYNKGYIGNIGSNRQEAPLLFIEQLGDLLGLPPGFENEQHSPSKDVDARLPSMLNGGLVGMRDAALLPMPSTKNGGLRDLIAKLENWTKRIPVPSFVTSPEVICVPIETNDFLRAGWRIGDVLLLHPNQIPRYGKLYAVTLSNGAGSIMKAVEAEDGSMVFRTIEGQVFSDDELFVDAIIVCHLPQYRPGKASGCFDEDGLEGSDW
jgi:hypothetical protein